MIYVFIIGLVAVIATAIVYSIRNAEEIVEEEPVKHQVRRITLIVKESSDKSKKKKKKPTVDKSAPVAKRPVGRPRKTTE